jgi:2-polyprenyl-3-methyl-5-hydroxy-6-metoxy-1,4-benzoquinol methylase
VHNSKPNIAHNLKKRNAAHAFAEQYIALRKKEQRIYRDEELRQLPSISAQHPHYKEWVARKHSSDKLLKYISKMPAPPAILEIGCGNGWLSNKLATIEGTEVTGFDINQLELHQAKKVFGHRLNLRFTSTDPFDAAAPKRLYDVIVFAASIQYFPSLHKIVSQSLEKLQPKGSIHIIDSHFYKPGDVPAARQRTKNYFASMGFPEMSANYFHHSLEELKPFNHKILYNPHSAWNRLMQRKDPFHWVCIKKN